VEDVGGDVVGGVGAGLRGALRGEVEVGGARVDGGAGQGGARQAAVVGVEGGVGGGVCEATLAAGNGSCAVEQGAVFLETFSNGAHDVI